MRTLHTQQFVKENIYQLVELHAVLENTLKVLSFHEALTPSPEEDKTSSGINPFLSKRVTSQVSPDKSALNDSVKINIYNILGSISSI